MTLIKGLLYILLLAVMIFFGSKWIHYLFKNNYIVECFQQMNNQNEIFTNNELTIFLRYIDDL
jgi:hypothetical protein